MKSVLLIGLGQFGKKIALELNELGHEVMAVDCISERVDDVLPYVTNAQIGDSTNEEFMNGLGVRNYDVCIVAIGKNFESSLETAALLKDLGAKNVIARANQDTQEKFLLRNGADHVVYPEKQMAKWTAIRSTSDHLLDFIQLDDRFSIFEISVPSDWVGATVSELDIRKRYNLTILAIKKDDRLDPMITGDTVLEEDDTLLILGEYQSLRKKFKI